jgi:hypothetical protein
MISQNELKTSSPRTGVLFLSSPGYPACFVPPAGRLGAFPDNFSGGFVICDYIGKESVLVS